MKTVMLECSRSINIMFLDYTNKNHAFGSVSEDKYHFRKENFVKMICQLKFARISYQNLLQFLSSCNL